MNCWTSAAINVLESCSPAAGHQDPSIPRTARANQVTPAAIDSTGNSGNGTERPCRAERRLTRASVTATHAKEPR
ncbi:MAG: hypothetical protein L0G94_20140 [Brachybacterium sp.]|uniref:hypothetical protein n=1 Tax=Brachybacterium sp. TaxID=1891286 RepID=UPI00264866E2|nr:hypothetical protein [Brachybacterium sp.]MDN5688966.1 hypothetical protein [Brachybacterium sp.]